MLVRERVPTKEVDGSFDIAEDDGLRPEGHRHPEDPAKFPCPAFSEGARRVGLEHGREHAKQPTLALGPLKFGGLDFGTALQYGPE